MCLMNILTEFFILYYKVFLKDFFDKKKCR